MGTRNEKVVLSLEDAGFTSGMARAAGQTALLDAALHHLDGSNVKVDGSSRSAAKSVDSLGTSSRRAEPSIDKLSGRLGLAARALGLLGPAAVPITTAAIPAVVGLTAALGAGALGAGVMVSAFQGVGKALDLVNKAQLEPTAENINAARDAMSQLAPEARQAVRAMQEWRPLLADIRNAGAAGFFPGFTQGLRELEQLAPEVEALWHKVGEAAGGLAQDTAGGITGPKGREFIAFVEREAAPTLTKFGHTVGNVASALGDLVMAGDPLSDNFLDGLLTGSERLAQWADGLTATKGYEEFIDYVRETGPQVVEMVGSLADALLQIGEAAAPLGGPVLQSIEAMADALAAIADSPLGTPIMTAVTALSLLSLTQKAFGGIAVASWLQAARGAQGYVAQLAAARGAAVGLGKGAALIGGMTLATSDFGRELGVSNTAMGATIGMMGGPWGAAIGTGVGALMDITSASKNASTAIAALNEAIAHGTRSDVQDSIEELQKQQTSLGNNWVSLIPVLGGWAKGLGWTSDSQDDLAAAIKRGDTALDDFGQSAASKRVEIDSLTNSTQVAAASAEGLAAAFTHANDVLSGRADLRAYEKAIDDATASLKEHGRTLDIDTEAGRTNQAALDAVASAGIRVANSMQGLDRVRALRRARSDFIRTATLMGKSRDDAINLWRELMKVDQADAAPSISTPGAAAALTTVRQLGQAIRDLDDKTITIRERTIRTYGVASNVTGIGTGTSAGMGILGTERPQALGGFYPARFYAGGGMDRRDGHMPEIARGGTWRVWAEDETGGETYIPHANDHRRPQAKRYLEKTAEMFGGTVEWYAGGGRRGASDREGIHELGKAAREAAKAMREERRARMENLKQERDQLKTSIMERFRSDIFAKPDNPWSDGGDWRSKLTADIAQAKSFNAATAALQGKGLQGQALGDLLQNADLSTVQSFANKSKAELADYRSLYETRARVSESAGRLAGDAAYGPQIADLQRELRGLRRDVNRSADRNAERVTNGVKNGVNNAARRGSRRGR